MKVCGNGFRLSSRTAWMDEIMKFIVLEDYPEKHGFDIELDFLELEAIRQYNPVGWLLLNEIREKGKLNCTIEVEV